MQPFFSIIIPTLNEEQCLPRLLEDLQNQNIRNFEVIVVDGGSSDMTITIPSHFPQLKIRCYKIKKSNVSIQRNFGAGKSQGKYLVFLDADSQIIRGFCKNLQHTIKMKPSLVYIPKILPEDKNIHSRLIFELVNIIIELSQLMPRPFSSGGNMIWEKNFFSLVGGFDEKLFLAEDHNIIGKAVSWGVHARYLDGIKIVFSLRRIEKEGNLRLYYKYIIATAYMVLKKKIDKKIFDYPMGGAGYSLSKSKKKKKYHLIDQLRSYLKQAERLIVDDVSKK
ncbi:hypothetical protein AUK04_01255 [Candidatus Roizmanbacteria bacterium CG2_30_33_16]|uniref:Glycosyltransferase 2-like domain-containing protein n=4 Tax=Candidatus Roizmaniibacteriota TaxID=1752723 RepID=A0A2H0C334_9BACT|nr:glycosyltransferase [Candidatus Roizmanbacteria bacterium]OIP85336.1 MAG: hypothetical protein AUK04_01255 [Candidatus Roizmanbacteria bacterium CG2_30_33_16]PIP64323.1 MAG: hypothetical protein COW96_03195 [Candidatus Roizmanbacteria bacterium CG22_combo_CG10-13_8_21_14_all_33_16]PIX74474.1 MAG: hypothetical protein COZ39_00350 [Candidatus Roizmanbacteria bacterium CG_4_10_14_3_um_filter_33_21]PJB88434.1 MAG: hypothetical protein CO083_02465 [Candidatus Roizmanbacteria bacterium CG_4_9_14_0